MGLGFLKNPARVFTAAATLGASELLPGGGQDQDANAEDATNAYGQQINDYRALGAKQGQRLIDQKAGAKGNYAGAQATLDYGWQAPTQQQDWYYNAKNQYGGTTNAQAYYNNAPPQNSYASGYYNSYQPNTYLQNYNKSRSVNPYTKVSSRLDELNGEGPGYAAGGLSDARAFASGPTGTGQRMKDRQYLGQDALDARYSERQRPVTDALDTRLADLKRLGPDMLDLRAKDRAAYNQTKTRSSGILDETQDPNAYSQRSDAYAGNLAGQTFDKNVGRLADVANSRQDDTAQFLDNYDPNRTQGLADTYSKLAAEGPTYEEQFYTSQLAGDNPAYNQLAKDLERQTATSSAARGGFVAGKTLDMQRRAGANLAADEFARRGDLAASAGNARRARLGQQLSGAQALDQQLLGQNQLKGQTAVARGGYLADLAKSRDTSNIEKSRQLSELAQFGDTQGLNLEKLRADVAHNEDMTQEQRQQALDTIDKQLSDRDLERQRQQNTVAQGLSTRDLADRGALDTLATGLSNRDAERQRQLDALATSGDTTETARYKSYLDQLNAADTYHTNEGQRGDKLAADYQADQTQQQKYLDDLAKYGSDEAANAADLRQRSAASASTEYQNWVNSRQQGARDADTSNIAQGTMLGGFAKNASEEQAGAQRDRFDAQLRMGNAQAAIDIAYDMAANGQMDETELAAIDAKLQQAGVPAQARKALADNFNRALQTGIEGYRAISGGGGGGGGGGSAPSAPTGRDYTGPVF
jgi:hypothetical protein